ncbi:chemotaxis protein CheB [Methylobacterium soli]|uniref:protein-glutamate methylesterase n=1 Tax=Methylobacterium soli TaxID=553447 RepID=A0A6L3SSU2_9HYPH|nr:chemotaxis protein CheB [Methylobacterium soli]KAB1070611.1 chemotaxis protein CheB [Methylobacterium soli]GJE43551.1 Protein-glutamate methylesterase/protein-glutamine glutaminase [Methylobacterium soli]
MSDVAIVVVGASLGGVGALQELTAGFNISIPAAFFVVQHIGRHRSLLPALLNQCSVLPAVHAYDGQPFRSNYIYVAPPDHHLCLTPHLIRLSRGPRENFARPAIDPLFRSAACCHGARVIGVLLTGRLSDGAAGLHEIRARGGLAIVQSPMEAACPDMPINALRHAGADHVLPLAAMPGLIARLAQGVISANEPSPSTEGEEHG